MYRETRKRQKIRSLQGVAAKERIRLDNADDRTNEVDPDDDEIEIVIRRKLTGEVVKFECTRGDRIDNYRVCCDGNFQGIQSMTTLTSNIRKALPAFRRME